MFSFWLTYITFCSKKETCCNFLLLKLSLSSLSMQCKDQIQSIPVHFPQLVVYCILYVEIQFHTNNKNSSKICVRVFKSPSSKVKSSVCFLATAVVTGQLIIFRFISFDKFAHTNILNCMKLESSSSSEIIKSNIYVNVAPFTTTA